MYEMIAPVFIVFFFAAYSLLAFLLAV